METIFFPSMREEQLHHTCDVENLRMIEKNELLKLQLTEKRMF